MLFLTSDKNLFILGTLFPYSPNQILLSAINSSNLSFVNLQQYPSGGNTFLPLGVVISYTFSSIIGPTDKSPDVHGPLISLSGFLYLEAPSSPLSNPLQTKLFIFLA